jgi:hypothetical protein
MSYAYAVEFLETDENLISAGYECTIGNAILANRPMTKITQRRFLS